MYNQDLSFIGDINNITKNCPNGVPIFLQILDLCVDDTKSWLAVVCGVISILAWVVYGLPQMIINCRKGIPDEAISPWLLIFWTIGDTSNMVGAILTRQLVLQIAMAGYAIFCDFILVGQFSYAVLKKRWKANVGPQDVIYGDNAGYVDSVSVNVTQDGLLAPKTTANITKVTGTALFCTSFLFISFLDILSSHTSSNTKYVGRTLFSSGTLLNAEPFIQGYREIFGYVLGCMSSLFYSSGRIPQMCMNFRRKCTEGLSAGLFIFAIIGNATYGAQILLVSLERNYMLKHLPWILGSWGVMILDCIILLQFFIYRNNDQTGYLLINADLDDESDVEILH